MRSRLGWTQCERKRIWDVTGLLLRRRVGRMPLYLGSSSKSGRERIRVATSACRRRGCLESIKGGDRDTSERPRRGCGVGADSGKRVLGRRRGRGDNHGGARKNIVESFVDRLHCRTRGRARRARRRRRRKDEVTEAGGQGNVKVIEEKAEEVSRTSLSSRPDFSRCRSRALRLPLALIRRITHYLHAASLAM